MKLRPVGRGQARCRRARQSGQATVELALCLPLIMVAMLLVLQTGLVVRDQLRTVHAARAAARQSAVSADDAAASAAAQASSNLDGSRLTVVISGRGEVGSTLSASVSYQARTDVPLVGVLLPDPVLRAAASMRVEG